MSSVFSVISSKFFSFKTKTGFSARSVLSFSLKKYFKRAKKKTKIRREMVRGDTYLRNLLLLLVLHSQISLHDGRI